MKDIIKIKELLTQASELFEKNIDNAHNYDCEVITQILDDIIEDLEDIGDFEVYDEN